MICLLTHQLEEDFLSACEFDPVIGARIHTLFLVYGIDSRVAELWIALDKGRPTAAISYFSGWVVISASAAADLDELEGFVRMLGDWQYLEAAETFCSRLTDMGSFTSANIMRYNGGLFLEEGFEVIDKAPKLREVYDVISSANPWFVKTTDWNSWYPYTSHIIRHNLGCAVAVYKDGKAVATGGVYNMGRDFAVIGSVATLPQHRKKGYAQLAVKSLVNLCISRGKTPALFCASRSMADYYAKIGFEDFGTFGEIERNR